MNTGYVRFWKTCGREVISQEDNERTISSMQSNTRGFGLSDIEKVELIGFSG